jgi:hypothetical protein
MATSSAPQHAVTADAAFTVDTKALEEIKAAKPWSKE